MKEPHIPNPRQLWNRHEELILEVIGEALVSLQKEKCLPIDENDISFRLYFQIRSANLKLRHKGRGLPSVPLWQGQNQPIEGDNPGTPRIRKEPDFQWQIVNDLEHDPDEAYRHYTIECKRLGTPPSNNWILNQNYVEEGVMRYMERDYGYGKGTPSGSMIGYVQSMEFASILNDVNLYARNNSIPQLAVYGEGWAQNKISRLEQSLKRSQVFPNQFSLRHLWIDLRVTLPRK